MTEKLKKWKDKMSKYESLIENLYYTYQEEGFVGSEVPFAMLQSLGLNDKIFKPNDFQFEMTDTLIFDLCPDLDEGTVSIMRNEKIIDTSSLLFTDDFYTELKEKAELVLIQKEEAEHYFG